MDYRIAAGDTRLPYLGHAAVVTLEEIDRSKAMSKYFEYGRYDAARLGEAHNRSPIPNVDLGPNGLPTKESLKTLLRALASRELRSEQPYRGGLLRDGREQHLKDNRLRLAMRQAERGSKAGALQHLVQQLWNIRRGRYRGRRREPSNRPRSATERQGLLLQSKADFSIKYDPETGKLDVSEEFFTANKTEILRWKSLPLWKRVFTDKPD